MILEYIYFFLGLTLLFFGGDFLIRSIRSLSYYFKVKPLFLSIVLLGIGTSAPEWFVTVLSSLEDFSDLALGNVVGSNISNIGLILGFFGLFHISSFSKSLVKFDLPVLILSFFFVIILSLGGSINRLESFFLILAFAVYIFFTIKNRKLEDHSVSQPSSKDPLPLSFVFIVSGFACLFIGSYLTIHSTVELGNHWGLSERFIGIFILSVGTSLPELSVSLQALFKKQEEVALGNIVGSNLFNTLFVLGSAGILSPIEVSPSFLQLDYWVMLGLVFLIWIGLILFRSIPRFLSILILTIYIIYIAFLFL